jgi:tetratricopeptide (TPR) repeat protein
MQRMVKFLKSAEHEGLTSFWGIGLRLLFSGLITGAAVICGTGLLFLVGSPAQDASTNQMGVRMIIVYSAGEAEKILERLKSGLEFAVLAREESVDPTAVNGGLLSSSDIATLQPELRDALKGLKPGQLSHIIQIPLGFAILKFLSQSDTADLEQADRARKAAWKALGNVRLPADVDGWSEALSALVRLPRTNGWDQDLQAICESYNQSFSVSMEGLEKILSPTSKEGADYVKYAKPLDVMQAHVAKGQLHAYQGEMAKAIEEWEIAYLIAVEKVPEAVPQMDEMLGVGYLHKSEMENDVYRNPGERCLFLMPPGIRYAKTASSEKAIQFFLRFLEKKPDELEVKWLLNLTYMTLGKYPASVPQKYLLPPALFTSIESVGRFKDVAPEAGLNLFVMASGVIVDDFDNDGLFEAVTTSWDSCEPMHYLHNNGKGIFTDQAVKAGLSKQLGGLNLIQTDYNNDGCLDILVLRGAWQPLGQRKSLLRNNCDGTFTDVTRESGLAKPATNTQAGVWADINNDGFLDLFVGNENGPSQLFLNKGDGTFTDISHSAGIDQTKFTKGVVAEDYDNDGYVDFYVSNTIGYNFLYHNKHDGTFTEIADQAGVPGTGRSFATWFFDYDNDGWPDVFDTAYQSSVDETVRTYLGLPHNAPSSRLYKNLGNGAFRDVTKEVGLDRVFMPMGANFGDVDNDGYLDIYLGTGDPSYASLVPNILFHNKEGKSFVDITVSSGTGELHKGHGIAFVDIDNDGDEDIFTSIGGAVPGDRHAFRLFENPGNGNDWISLRLVGSKSNRAAIGAKIKVTVKNEGQAIRAIYRTVGSGGSFGASPLQQHIGLGKSAQIVSLEITWPGGSRTPQIFSKVSNNQFLEIKEFAADYTKLERRPFHLGGAKSEASIHLHHSSDLHKQKVADGVIQQGIQ